jgi:hypothetical protein
MSGEFSYTCHTCGQVHAGMPSFGWDYPAEYLMLPEAERAQRSALTTETCVIDASTFFVRGCVELPVHDSQEPFVWGLWVSLSERSFANYTAHYSGAGGGKPEPLFGWLTTVPPMYPDALLKTMVHLRPPPERPYIELEPTNHPLAIEQREGISLSRLEAIADHVLHGSR